MNIKSIRPGVKAVRLLALAAILAANGTVTAEDSQGKTDPSALLLKTRCDVFDQARQQCLLWGPSLLELITRPEIYDGRRIRVIGSVSFEFEGNAPYLSRSDGLTRSAVWINPPHGFESDWGPAGAQPNHRYVIVEATFKAARRGHGNLFSGALEAVTRLDPWR